MSEQDCDSVLDPFERLYRAIAEEARQDVLRKPYDPETWMYLRRPPLRFRASESGNCSRRTWYRLTGCVPAPDSPELKLKQLEGNIAQDVIRDLFVKYDIPIDAIDFKPDGTQVETDDKIRDFTVEGRHGPEYVRVSARSDGRLPETPEGPARFEFKTINHFKNFWLKKAYDGHWPKMGKGLDAVKARIIEKNPYYYTQVQITMAVFDDPPRMYFGTKNRSDVEFGFPTADGQRTGVYFDRNDDAIDEILCTFAMIQRGVRANKAPAPMLAGSVSCSFCPFHYRCHGVAENKGEIIYPGEKA